MPFNSYVGDKLDYKSAKPTNWKPGFTLHIIFFLDIKLKLSIIGDYTKYTTELPANEECIILC